MHRWIVLSMSVMSLLGAQSPTYKTEDTPDGKMYVIAGSEHSEDIPEHSYWRHAFHKLANIKKLD
jgi:hypothetical protein